ncbi:MAG: primosomal protein N' [Deltaproteobacteria bacterium]|nr:primosomal protein N' [Deltaproteobacteria bacterium]
MLIHVAIDVPVNTAFTYKVPEEFVPLVSPGTRVLVPFRSKQMIGFCLGSMDDESKTDTATKNVCRDKIKSIIRVFEDDVNGLKLDRSYLKWIEFASDYYHTPVGQILSQAVPSYYFNLKYIDTHKKIRSKEITIDSVFKTTTVELTPDQNAVHDEILKNFDQYYPALIKGVTGSGKTEIYIKLIKHAFAKKRSALFLVPEIGITPQMLARLNHHFKGRLLVYHSGLTKNQRFNQWTRSLNDAPVVMIGTRSALFCPLKDLGVIIIDEEQDPSYKQEERFKYNARDLAVARAGILKIPVVLGSATPSLESYYLADQKKYHAFTLKNRIGKSRLPEIRVVDLKKEREQTGAHFLVSQNIHQAIEHFSKDKQQILLFVGQRGYAQNAFCVLCKEIQLCPNCSVGLKYHKENNILKCHYCDYQRKFDEVCLCCHEKKLTLLGFGTETIYEEVKSMHPSLVIERLDSDAAPTAKEFNAILNKFASHKIDMIIGTQMITKGHDFGNIGFVGILGIDTHLGLPDFRSGERAFQNIVQVAGRAGRSEKKGHVIIQSLMPDHGSIRLGMTQSYEEFASEELKIRELLHYPPFSRIIQWRFLSNKKNTLKEFLSKWNIFLNHVRKKTNTDDIQILGPAEMPILKVRGKYRYHVLFKVRRGLKIKDLINYVQGDLEKRKPKGVQYQIDVDPQSLI